MKKTQSKTIPIFFAVDDNYIPFLATALESLIDNSSDKHLYDVNILIEKLDGEKMKIISNMQTPHVKISFINVSKNVASLCTRLHLRDYYTKATYYRFFIPELFPMYDKGVYLDCDIILSEDIAKMYNHSLGNDLVAAINDEVITDIEVFAAYSEICLGIPKNKYFNAGILVMNLAEMRKMHIEEIFADLLSKKTYRVAQDQDYLNVICRGRVKYLSTLWNKTPTPYSNKNIIPYIAHYKINYKPWRYDGIVYGELFWKYAERTPFYSALLESKANYTDAERQRDSAQYSALEELAAKEVYDELRARSAFFGDSFFPLEINIDGENEIIGVKQLVAEAV